MKNINFMYLNKKVLTSIKIVFAIILTGVSVKVNAQTQWLDHGPGNSVSLEIYKPFIPRDTFPTSGGYVTPGYTASTMAFFLSGRYDISKKFTLVADIPFVNGEYDDSIASGYGGFKFGNPYIGAEYHLPNSPVKALFGFRIPLVSEDNVVASVAGVRSDIDRSEAFIREIVPFYAAVNFETVSESKILVKGKVGADLWFNTKVIGIDNQPELSANYALQLGYLQKDVHFIFGLSGRYEMDSGPKYPEKKNLMQYGLLVTFPYKNIRPAFSVKVPGSDALGKIINYVLGLNFTYSI
jgi:hypothetical protein